MSDGETPDLISQDETEQAGWTPELGERIAEAEERKRERERPLPGAVTFIAVYQFAKALLLILIVLAIRYLQDARYDSPARAQTALFLGLHRSLPIELIIYVIIPMQAVYYVVVGSGLLMRNRWARRILILSSAWYVLAVVRALIWRIAFGDLPSARSQVATLIAIGMIELIVLGCLLWYSDVSTAFRDEESGGDFLD